MTKPFVSYVLTAYNIEDFIEESVKCAFAQTYENLEIILSDDHSTDGTYDIMKQMAQEYQGPHKVVLNRFLAHSARDENTATILKELTGKTPVRVLDPALLYGFEKEKSEWNRRLIDEKYMVVYTWGGTSVTETFKDGVLALAKKHGLKTVSVGDRRPWCDYDYSSAPPEQFFALYRHCDLVLTNMFHGTCFAVINEKPFYTCVMEYNKNKLGDLLHFIGLDSQRIDDLTDIPKKDIPQIDYEKVNAFLREQREKSMQYIQENLH